MRKRCLVIKNDGIGDLVCASGVISQLAERFPGGVDLITCEHNREIAEHIPGLRKILYVSRDSISTFHRKSERYRNNPILKRISLPYSPFSGDYRVFFHLLTTRYDSAISLRRYIRFASAELMSLARAKNKYSCWQFPTNFERDLAVRMSRGHNYICPTSKVMWEPNYYKKVLEAAFGGTFIQDPHLRIPDHVTPEIPQDSIGIIITERYKNTWPDDYWSYAISRLLERGRPLFVFGDSQSHPALREKFSSNVRFHDYCGKLSLLEHVSYFKKLSGILAEDTGITHLGALSGTKVLVLQAGLGNGFFFPWQTVRPSNVSAIYHTLHCFGCHLRNNNSPSCKPLKGPKIECILRVKPQLALEYFYKLLAGETLLPRIDLCPDRRIVQHDERAQALKLETLQPPDLH